MRIMEREYDNGWYSCLLTTGDAYQKGFWILEFSTPTGPVRSLAGIGILDGETLEIQICWVVFRGWKAWLLLLALAIIFL